MNDRLGNPPFFYYYYYYYYCYHYLFYSLRAFHTSVRWKFFDWNLSDSKSLKVSRTLHGIQTDLSNIVVWMFTILSVVFNFSCLYSKP